MPYVFLDNLQQRAAINLTADPGYDRGDHTIPSTAAIILTWTTASGKVARNILHARYTGTFAGSQAQCNGILSGLTSGAQWTALALHIAPTASLAFVSIRDVAQENQPLISSNGAAHPGTSTGTELPDEVAAVLTLRTAFTGRQHRGRMYIPGWATTALATGNVIAPAAVTALANWGSIIAGVLSANGGYLWGIGHLHRLAYTSPIGTPIPERPAGLVPIQSTEVRDNHWDSMRRRGLK